MNNEERPLAVFIVILILLWLLLAAYGPPARAASLIPSRYDEQIQSAAHKFWLDYPDWKLWKSQLYQESHLDPNAQSGVGAQGLAQFMPATWEDISRALGFGLVSRTMAGPAIDGGAYYMAKLRAIWKGRGRSEDARHALAEAAYNAGTGSVLQAQAKCADAILWASIAPCMALVTGEKNAKQTRDYVTMIAKWRGLLN